MSELSVTKHMFQFSVRKGGGSRERSDIYMSNTNCQELKISHEHGKVVTTLNRIKP